MGKEGVLSYRHRWTRWVLESAPIATESIQQRSAQTEQCDGSDAQNPKEPQEGTTLEDQPFTVGWQSKSYHSDRSKRKNILPAPPILPPEGYHNHSQKNYHHDVHQNNRSVLVWHQHFHRNNHHHSWHQNHQWIRQQNTSILRDLISEAIAICISVACRAALCIFLIEIGVAVFINGISTNL